MCLLPRGVDISSPIGLTLDKRWAHSDNKDHFSRAIRTSVPTYSDPYRLNTLFLVSKEQRHYHDIPRLLTMPARVTRLLDHLWYIEATRYWYKEREAKTKKRAERQQLLPVETRTSGDDGRLVEVLIIRQRASPDRSEQPTWPNMHLTEPSITTFWIEVFTYTSRTQWKEGIAFATVQSHSRFQVQPLRASGGHNIVEIC
jgi:hypothetical protein